MKKNSLLRKMLGIYLFTVVDDGEGGGASDEGHIPTQEEIAREFDPSLNNDDNSLEDDGKDATPKEEAGGEEAAEEAAKEQLDDYLTEFRAMVGEDYEIPKEIQKASTKEKLEFITKEIAKAVQPKDPFVQAYMKAKIEGREQNLLRGVTKAYSNLEKNDKDFYKDYLMNTKGKSEKRPNGVSEEEIEKYIEDMNALDLKERADKSREIYKNNLDQYFNKVNKDADNRQSKSLEEINMTTQKFIEPYVKIISKEGLDVPFSEELTKEYLEAIPKVVVKDKTYQNDVERFLSDDKNMLKMLPYIWMVMNNKEKAVFSNIKETTKQNAMKKFFNEENQGGAATVPGKVDFNKLYAPDTQ